jgi:hypothetical protein
MTDPHVLLHPKFHTAKFVYFIYFRDASASEHLRGSNWLLLPKHLGLIHRYCVARDLISQKKWRLSITRLKRAESFEELENNSWDCYRRKILEDWLEWRSEVKLPAIIDNKSFCPISLTSVLLRLVKYFVVLKSHLQAEKLILINNANIPCLLKSRESN